MQGLIHRAMTPKMCLISQNPSSLNVFSRSSIVAPEITSDEDSSLLEYDNVISPEVMKSELAIKEYEESWHKKAKASSLLPLWQLYGLEVQFPLSTIYSISNIYVVNVERPGVVPLDFENLMDTMEGPRDYFIRWKTSYSCLTIVLAF